MKSQASNDLIEICNLFLTPATILFAAIGIAETEGLKTGISFIGAVLSAVWFLRALSWEQLFQRNRLMALTLALVFFAVAATSLKVHAENYWAGKDNGKTPTHTALLCLLCSTSSE